MTNDLAAEGDRLHAEVHGNATIQDEIAWHMWFDRNWPAIAAALRERDEDEGVIRVLRRQRDEAEARAETAEADADRLAMAVGTFQVTRQRADLLAAHTVAVEARPPMKGGETPMTTYKVLTRHNDGSVALVYATPSASAAHSKLYWAKQVAAVTGHGHPFIQTTSE